MIECAQYHGNTNLSYFNTTLAYFPPGLNREIVMRKEELETRW